MNSHPSPVSLAHWGAFRAQVRAGRICDVAPFERDPHPSPLIRSIPSAVHAGTRITEPFVRKGYLEGGPHRPQRARGQEPFVAVPWDEALDLVSRDLGRVKAEFGNEAIFGGSYGWSSAGRVNHARTLLHRFLNGFGGHVGQMTNYSWGAAAVLLPHVLGDIEMVSGPLPSWPDIVANADLMVMFGGAALKNARITSGGAGAHDYETWLRSARAAGVDFTVIAPCQGDAPDFLEADLIAPRPNTDTALMLGIAHTLVVDGSVDREFLSRYCVGYERFEAYLTGASDGRPKDAEWASAIADVERGVITALARRMASCRTMLTATWSLQRADHGEQPYWMLITLAAMLGGIGLPGEGFGFGYGSINGMGSPRQPIPTPTMEEGVNPIRTAIPVARVSDLLLNPGQEIDFNGSRIRLPDIRLVYWAGGNPFHHHQDINRLLEAWSRPETIIVHEPWWTATARHADIVLPATTPYERNDVGSSPRDRHIIAMPRLIEPVGAARNDYEIFADLAARLGFWEAFTENRDIDQWVRHSYETARAKAAMRGVEMVDFDTFWDAGFIEIPASKTPAVPFADFRRDPIAHPLATPSGRIEIFSNTIAGFGYEDCPGHAVWLPPLEWLGAEAVARFPLHVISPQPATRLHSQLDDAVLSRAAKIEGREAVLIHARDAAARGIADGDVVIIHNDRGACVAGALVTEEVRPGVVVMATGAWYDPEQPGVAGTLDKHGNPNMLTRDAGTSALGQGCAAQSALVEVSPLSRPVAPVSAFDLPPIAQRA